MLRKIAREKKIIGFCIDKDYPSGYRLVRYHSDYGVYTHETVLSNVKVEWYSNEKKFRNELESQIREKYGKELPKTIYVEQYIL